MGFSKHVQNFLSRGIVLLVLYLCIYTYVSVWLDFVYLLKYTSEEPSMETDSSKEQSRMRQALSKNSRYVSHTLFTTRSLAKLPQAGVTTVTRETEPMRNYRRKEGLTCLPLLLGQEALSLHSKCNQTQPRQKLAAGSGTSACFSLLCTQTLSATPIRHVGAACCQTESKTEGGGEGRGWGGGRSVDAA